MLGEMHVKLAPVSIKAGNVVICVDTTAPGVRMPVGSTPTLMSGPIRGSKLRLRHGMGKEPQIYWCVGHLLNRKETVGGKQLLTSNVGISCCVKELDNLPMPHQGKLP